MHPLFNKAAGLTETVIGAAIEVHRDKGPGLLESIYEWCFTIELGLRNLSWQRQERVTIEYKVTPAKNLCAATSLSKAA